MISDVPALDDFDNTCKLHDAAYAERRGLHDADFNFARANLLSGNPKRMLAGLLVGVQGLSRPHDRSSPSTMTKSNLRGNLPRSTKGQTKPAQSMNTTRSGNDVARAAPVSVATRRTGKAPQMKARGAGVTVSHRTFLGPVSSQSAFTPTSYSVNPGLVDTFPWLSRVAARYDKYRFTRLRFEYRSVCATNVPGVVMMSFDYNAADQLPLSKSVQAQTIPNAENNVWMNNDLVVPCDNNWRFVRQALVANTDIKTYDLGNLVLSSIYGSGITTGELYVEYTVELEKPSEPEAIAAFFSTTGAGIGSPWGGSVAITGVPTFNLISASAWSARVGGVYLITYQATGTGIVSLAQPSGNAGVSITTVQSSTVNATATSAMRSIRVVIQRSDFLDWSAVVSATSLAFISASVTEWF